MELRYCETCGKVLPLKGENEEINPTEHYLCAQCRGRGAKPASGAGEAKKSHGTLDFLSSPLEEGQLDLFSKATLVKFKKKKKHGSGLLGLQVEEPPPMELLDETSTGSSSPSRSAKKIQFNCPRCKSVLQIRPVKSTSRMICPNCKLNLFIDESCRISETPPGPPKLPAEARASAGPAVDSRKGFRKSAQPEPVKLQFHCLHCRVLLRVQRVSEPSRMICPKCKRDLFIDAAGIVSKVPPRVPRAAKAPPKPPAPVHELAPPPARERAPVPEPPPAAPAAPAPAPPEKAAAPEPAPKKPRKRRRKARARPNMVRVSTSLPAEIVATIENSGRAVSKVIREIVEQKVRMPEPPKGPPIPM